MDKLIFLFPRKDGLTRDEFFAHYLEVHAPLGLELTRTMAHYTVNLCDREGGADDGVDAITETWTDSVADFMDPDKSFATPEDAQRLFADHDSFIGAPYDAYAVEERVSKGPERLPPDHGRSPGAKVVVAVSDDDGTGSDGRVGRARRGHALRREPGRDRVDDGRVPSGALIRRGVRRRSRRARSRHRSARGHGRGHPYRE